MPQARKLPDAGAGRIDIGGDINVDEIGAVGGYAGADGLDIYREIESLEKTRVGVRRSTEYSDTYLLFLVPGAVLLIIEMLLTATLFRRAP